MRSATSITRQAALLSRVGCLPTMPNSPQLLCALDRRVLSFGRKFLSKNAAVDFAGGWRFVCGIVFGTRYCDCPNPLWRHHWPAWNKSQQVPWYPLCPTPRGKPQMGSPCQSTSSLTPPFLLHFFRPSLSKRNKKTHHVTFPSSFLHPQRVAETNVFFLLLSTACTSVCECNVLSCWMHAKVRSAATHVSSYDL